MSRYEERQIVNVYRRRSVMDPRAKRDIIAKLAEEGARLAHYAPALAALALPDLWAARRRLDWGCRAVVA